jgi:hypothetical protein
MSKFFNHNSDKKVEFIKLLFKRYQPTLSVPEQFALLDMWINSCVDAQEFEMASALLKEKRHITNNLETVPRRTEGEPMVFDDTNPLFSYRKLLNPEVFEKETEKQSIYRKIIDKIKKFFKWQK